MCPRPPGWPPLISLIVHDLAAGMTGTYVKMVCNVVIMMLFTPFILRWILGYMHAVPRRERGASMAKIKCGVLQSNQSDEI